MKSLLVLLYFLPLFLFAQTTTDFTETERAWLKNQSEITIGAMDHWAPFNFLDYKSEPSGIGADIIAALNKRLDGKLKIVSSDWSDIYHRAKNGELHAIMDITAKVEREDSFYFTRPYLQVPHVIVSHVKQAPFNSLADLNGKRVALEKEIGTIAYLEKNFPSIIIHTYANTSQCLDALSKGDVDAYIGNRAVVTYTMTKELLGNIKIDALDLSRKSSPLSIGISKRYPLLHVILQKAFDSIAQEELNAIFSKWSKEKGIDLPLNDEEKNYLRDKRYLHFVAPLEEWYPFSFTDEFNRRVGLEIDFLHLLESHLKTPIHITYLPWSDALQKAQSFAFDGIISASPTPERKKSLIFSDAYYLSPLALLTSKKHPTITQWEEFKGHSIAVLRDSALATLIKEVRPDIKILYGKDVKHLVKMVLTEEADAALDYKPSFNYEVEKASLQTSLHLALTLFSDSLSSYQYATNKHEPLLASIINKAIATYAHEDKKAIKERWEGKREIPSSFQTENQKLLLTPEELAWIKANPTISIANEPDWPPFDFIQNSKAFGLGIDYVELIAQKVGLHVKYTQAPWEELLKQFKQGKIDLLHSVYKTPEREAYALFTQPFYTSYNAMAVRKGSNITSLQQLKGKKVVILKGYGLSETLLKTIPNIQPIEVTNLYDGLKAVSFGEADAVIESIGSMSYVVMEQTLTNLHMVKVELDGDNESGKLHFAMLKDKPILKAIYNKAIASISQEEHARIRSKWLLHMDPTPQTKQTELFLSDAERAWLKKNSLIRFTGDPNYLPYEAFQKDGTYIGLMAEHLEMIEALLGIRFERIPSKTWQDALDKTHKGEVDVLSTYVNDALFQKTHISVPTDIKSPIVIVSKKNRREHFIADLEQLGNDKIAVIKDYSYLDAIFEQHPKLNYVKVNNATEGLEGVASGQYDAMLCSLALATYKINELGLSNLQIVGKTDFTMQLSFTVKNEFAPLASILEKVIEAHAFTEHKDMLNKWEAFTLKKGVDYTLVLEIVSSAFALLMLLLYFNYQLKRQVARKTAELSRLLKSFDTHVIASKTDLDGNITYVSDAFCEISGTTREEVLGKNHRISRHPENDPKVYEQLWETITHGGVWKGRIKNLKKDGGYYWVDSIIEQDKDVHGNVIGYTSIRHDVTAQVELQELSEKLESIIEDRTQELALRNDELQAIFDSTSVGIALLKNRIILQCNQRMDEIFGYEIGEQLWAKTDIWYETSPDLDTIYTHIWAGDIATWDQKLIRKDKSTFWGRVAAKAIDTKDENKGVVAVIEDITHEKRALEEMYKAKLLAEEATRIKSDFLANMSHEIRTPMNAIIGMAHLALQTNLTQKQRNYLSKINGASRNLLGIINDILDFSKIEAGKMSFEEIDFYLEDVMDHLADLCVMKAQEKGLELLFDVSTDIPTALRGDPLRLGQVLINLVNNAIKFTEFGEIKVSIRILEENHATIKLHFEVSDTGIGISKEHQEKLFQAFSQADESTTRRYGGSGLGLAISKHLVEAMHGNIGVKSIMGKGSNFFFDATFMVQEHQKRIIFNDEDIKNLRILVVDDNKSSREILENILRSFHFDVHSVADGYEAIQILKKAYEEDNPFGLVLMDWMMPGMDGVETIKQMREESGLAQTVAFIMITAYSRDELKTHLETIRIDGILIKPISPSILLNTILEILGKEIVIHSRKEDKKILYQGALESLQGASILLVEDNIVNQEMAVEILEDAGLHVHIANNGFEALAKLREGVFDGILMDCQMPIMDGFEATKAIRQQPQYASLPILAMTANAMAGDKERCFLAGMNDHIAKPIDVSQLFLTMAKWINPDKKIIQKITHAGIKKEALNTLMDLSILDITGALERVDGNSHLLENLLIRFTQTQSTVIPRIKDAIESNDIQLAIREAHTLKGLAGNIGATALFEEAQELERMLLHDEVETLDTRLNHIEMILNTIFQAISETLAKEKSSFLPLAKEELLKKLDYLNTLLNDLDSEALEVMEEILPSLFEMSSEESTLALQTQINNFDFEKARLTLQSIQKSFYM